MTSKGEIAYTKDIVDRMEKELGIPREKIEANIKLLIKSMKVRSDEVECGTMYLSGLGTMYFRVNTVYRIIERLEGIGRKLSANMQNLKKKVFLLRPKLDFSRYNTPQLRIERTKNKYLNKKMDLKQVEEFQNRKYNEFTKD